MFNLLSERNRTLDQGDSRLNGPTRRLVLGSLLSSIACGQTKKPKKLMSQQALLNLTLDFKNGTKVIYTNPDGTPRSGILKPLGLAVATPQGCRAARPGGTGLYPGGSGPYGSREWIKELIFVGGSDVNIAKTARTWLSPYRIGNDQYSRGCGHISMNVTVTQLIKPTGGNSFTEQPYPSAARPPFYTLVADGSPLDPDDPTSEFKATTIWICDAPWATNTPEFANAISRASAVNAACKE